MKTSYKYTRYLYSLFKYKDFLLAFYEIKKNKKPVIESELMN